MLLKYSEKFFNEEYPSGYTYVGIYIPLYGLTDLTIDAAYEVVIEFYNEHAADELLHHKTPAERLRIIAGHSDGRRLIAEYDKPYTSAHFAGQQDSGNVRYVPDWYIKSEGPVSRYRLGNVMYSERLYEPMDKDEYRRRNFGIEPTPKPSIARAAIDGVVAAVGAIVGAPVAPPAAAPAVVIPPEPIMDLIDLNKELGNPVGVEYMGDESEGEEPEGEEPEDSPEEQARAEAKYKTMVKEKEEKEEKEEEEVMTEEEFFALMEEEPVKEKEGKTAAEVLETLKDKPPEDEDIHVRDELIVKYERELPAYDDSQKQMYRKEYNDFVSRVNAIRVMFKEDLDKAVAKLEVPVQHYTRDNYIILIKNELEKANKRLASKVSSEEELATYNDDFVQSVLMKKTPKHIRGEDNSPKIPQEVFDSMLSETGKKKQKK